jgi:hypothetical protein
MTTSHRPDKVLYPDARPDEDVLEADLTQRMIRRPTDADIEEVMTPEANSGDTVGSDVSDSTMATNDSLGGTD